MDDPPHPSLACDVHATDPAASLGPRGELSLKANATELFVTQRLSYIESLRWQTQKGRGRHRHDFDVLVRFEMAPGTRDALEERGRTSEVIGSDLNAVHVR